MEEALSVLSRLERIEELTRAAAEPAVLLAELRELLQAAQAWSEAEGEEAARRAVDGFRSALEAGA